jgi:hypothetical protein
VDTDDPGGMRFPGDRRGASKRSVWVSDPGLTIGMATTVLGLLLLLATPASAADPLPSLPVALPSLPVRTLALPTPTLPTLPPLPTLPVPTPTLHIPTPTLPVATPTLPLSTPTPRPTATAQPSPSTTPSPSRSAAPSIAGGGPVGSATAIGAPVVGGPVVASGVPEGPGSPTVVDRGSPFDSFVIPGLIVGVPIIIILGILAAQLAVGAAWMPVIRRWLNRRV